MLAEPATKRAVTFIDGQNLFHAVKEAFGYRHPNYDILSLSKTVCKNAGFDLAQARFYTGVPDISDNPFWHHFWTQKLRTISWQKVHVFSRSLRYRNKTITLPDGKQHTFMVGQEKGVDVRLALDIVRLAHERVYDVAVIFSQDQDLSEVAEEVRLIGRQQNRWIKLACAFPISPTSRNMRGINKTDWIRIDRATYDSCLDSRDYRS